MKNPKIVVDNIIDSDGVNSENQIKIYPMTIRRYAWFETLESPFIDATKTFTVNSIIPSVYIMCLSNDEIKQYNTKDVEKIISNAFDWAENLSLNDIPEMIQAVTKQMQDLNKVSPDAVDNQKGNSKKK
jgi:hypothetical protein